MRKNTPGVVGISAMLVGDIYEEAIVSECRDQTAVNVLHWEVFASTIAGDQPQAVANRLGVLHAGNYADCLSLDAKLAAVKATKIWPLPRTITAINTAVSIPGTRAAKVMPLQVSGIITWLSTLAQRKNRGRSYIPFPSQADANNVTFHPNAGYQTSLGILAGTLLTTVTVTVGAQTADMQLVIWQRATHTFIPVATARENLKWATQRRRGDYGRPNAPIA